MSKCLRFSWPPTFSKINVSYKNPSSSFELLFSTYDETKLCVIAAIARHLSRSEAVTETASPHTTLTPKCS